MHSIPRLIAILIGISILGLTSICSAADDSTSGGLLLKQAVGARAQGMGEAFVAVADDVTSLFWNTASLGQLTASSIQASYQTGIAESSFEQFLYAQKIGNYGGLGIGLILFQGGMMTLDNSDGSESEVQSQSDLVISAGYGFALSKQLNLGGSFKFYSSTLIEEYSASAVALDVGALLKVNKHLSVGLALQNAGTEVTYQDESDPLPLTARLGAAYLIKIKKKHRTTLGMDLVKENDSTMALHTGFEYWYDSLFATRLGYKAGYDLEGLTAGLGFKLNPIQLDYAFALIQELDSTHKVSLSVVF